MKSGPYIIDDFAVLIMKEGTEILSVADSMSTISSILETSCKVVLPDLIPSGPDGLWIIVITTETEECFKDEETISCVRIEVGESTYLN
jgi:hypothetical protein